MRSRRNTTSNSPMSSPRLNNSSQSPLLRENRLVFIPDLSSLVTCRSSFLQRIDTGRPSDQRLAVPLIESLAAQQRTNIFEQLRAIVGVPDPIGPCRRRVDHINFL